MFTKFRSVLGCGLALAAATGLALSFGVRAEEGGAQVLVLASPAKGGGYEVSVDYLADGKAVAVSVDLGVGDLAKAAPSTEACASISGKSGGNWQGGCSIVDGVARFVAVNFDLKPFQKGWHSLGTFTLSSLPKSGIEVRQVKAGDATGAHLPVSSKFTWVE